jgi:hypothetical protein
MGCAGNNGFVQSAALPLFDASARRAEFDNLGRLSGNRASEL